MEYTTDDINKIVFLNDKNIVNTLSDDSKTGINAIPAQSLIVSCYNALSTYSEQLCGQLCTQIGNDLSDLSTKMMASADSKFSLITDVYSKVDANANAASLSNALTAFTAENFAYTSNVYAISDVNEISDTLSNEITATYLKNSGGTIGGGLSITSSLAVGKNASVSVSADNSIAFGHNAYATHHNTFVWNGSDIEDTDGKSDYSSNDSHTFNLNPANGLCGIYVGKNTLCSLISEDIKLSANAITADICATYAKISDVYKLTEIDNISAELCSAVSSQYYVKKNDVNFAYDINNHVLNLSVADKILSVSTNQFEVGRFIHKVYLTADGDTTYLAIQFKIVGDSDSPSKSVDDATTDSIDTHDAGTTIVDDALGSTLQEIRIDISKLVQLYTAGQGISITFDEHGYKVSINDDIYNNIEKIDEIEEYVDKLSGDGTSANPGIIATITSDVDVLKIQDTRELKFDKIITLDESNLTSSKKLYLSALIGSESAHEDDVIRNGSIFLVQYSDDADKSKKYETADGAILGDNDFIVIRTLGKYETELKLANLKVANSAGSIDKNVYITNAVHRYEYENLSSDLSNAIVNANTKIDKKIYIDGVSAETLCAEHIDADTFHKLVISGDLVSNMMYIVSSDYINAYDQQIQNVADPVEAQDAATKAYVDNAAVFNNDIKITHAFGKYVPDEKTGYAVVSCKGMTLKEFIDSALVERKSGTVTYPSFTLDAGGDKACEIGTTYVLPAATLKMTSVGNYQYGPDTGIVVPAMSAIVKCTTAGYTSILTTNSVSIGLDGTLVTAAGTTKTTYLSTGQSYVFNAEATYTDGAKPNNNLGETDADTTKQIKSSRVTRSATVTYTGQYPAYYAFTTKPTTNPTLIVTNNGNVTVDGIEYVRELNEFSRSSFTATGRWYELFYIIPSGKHKNKKWSGKDSNNINLAVDTTTSATVTFMNDTSATYDVFVIRNAAPYSSTTCRMTFE